MAKVKTAKEKITAYLKGKGLSIDEIKDAFDELEAADQDLDRLAADVTDATTKNKEWLDWYQKVAPEVKNVFSERDTLKQKLDKLEKLGIQIGEGTPAPAAPAGTPPQGDYITKAQLEEWERNFGSRTSKVIKGVSGITARHMKEFGEAPDLDAIEKLMSDGLPMDVAYEKVYAPKYEEKRKAKTKEEVDRLVREGVQAELSKKGIAYSRKKVVDVEPAPLDKPAPNDHDLREAFLMDLNADTTH